MTPEQRTALIAACDEGNDVRIVTMALHIAAHLARERRNGEAATIRDLVDEHDRSDGYDREFRRMRLDVAKRLIGHTCGIREAIDMADTLIVSCAQVAVPE